MDDPQRPPAGPPALRPPGPHLPVPAPAPGDPPPAGRPPLWKRLTRTRRGAAGLGVVAAALLLWPFAGWSWIPWLAGLVVLVLLAVLRLDRLLRGWTWHVAGLAVVAGLMVSSSPWAWAVAASIGVLVAGLLRLPAWHLAAVGAVLCVASGAALAFSTYETREQAAAAQTARNESDRGLYGAPRPQGVLPILLGRIAADSPGAVCDNLMAAATHAAFAASVGQPDCAAAVRQIATQVTDPGEYADAEAPSVEQGDGIVVDACALTWDGAAPAGPPLGRLTVGRAPNGPTYVVTAFAPC